MRPVTLIILCALILSAFALLGCATEVVREVEVTRDVEVEVVVTATPDPNAPTQTGQTSAQTSQAAPPTSSGAPAASTPRPDVRHRPLRRRPRQRPRAPPTCPKTCTSWASRRT